MLNNKVIFDMFLYQKWWGEFEVGVVVCAESIKK